MYNVSTTWSGTGYLTKILLYIFRTSAWYVHAGLSMVACIFGSTTSHDSSNVSNTVQTIDNPYYQTCPLRWEDVFPILDPRTGSVVISRVDATHSLYPLLDSAYRSFGGRRGVSTAIGVTGYRPPSTGLEEHLMCTHADNIVPPADIFFVLFSVYLLGYVIGRMSTRTS